MALVRKKTFIPHKRFHITVLQNLNYYAISLDISYLSSTDKSLYLSISILFWSISFLWVIKNYTTKKGIVRNIDTSKLKVDDELYLDPNNAGALTRVPPINKDPLYWDNEIQEYRYTATNEIVSGPPEPMSDFIYYDKSDNIFKYIENCTNVSIEDRNKIKIFNGVWMYEYRNNVYQEIRDSLDSDIIGIIVDQTDKALNESSIEDGRIFYDEADKSLKVNNGVPPFIQLQATIICDIIYNDITQGGLKYIKNDNPVPNAIQRHIMIRGDNYIYCVENNKDEKLVITIPNDKPNPSIPLSDKPFKLMTEDGKFTDIRLK